MIWKEIKGFPGYFVNNEGQIRTTGLRPGILKPAIDKGYKKIAMMRDGKHCTKRVHRIVAENWVPNPDNLPCVNHLDANKLNNNASNLEWCTHDTNMKHAWALGLPRTHYGEAHGMSKLSDEQIIEIRRLYATGGTSYPKLSRQFGISRSNAHRIVTKQIWKTV